MPLLENFRKNLRRLIDQSEESKTAVAERAGIHRVTLHGILSGKFDPSLETCEKLAEVLGCNPPEKIFQENAPRRKRSA